MQPVGSPGRHYAEEQPHKERQHIQKYSRSSGDSESITTQLTKVLNCVHRHVRSGSSTSIGRRHWHRLRRCCYTRCWSSGVRYNTGTTWCTGFSPFVRDSECSSIRHRGRNNRLRRRVEVKSLFIYGSRVILYVEE